MSKNIIFGAGEHCDTRMEFSDKVEFQWVIRNFSCMFLDEPSALYSPVFPADEHRENTWQLKVTKNALTDFYSCLVLLDSCKNAPLKVSCELSILGPDSEKILTSTWQGNVKVGQSAVWWHRNSKEMSVIDDTIAFKCEIKLMTIVHSQWCAGVESAGDCEHPVIRNLGHLLSQQFITDVTIRVRERQFRAHKIILAAASPVFAAMFQKDTKEEQTNEVNIADIDEDVFEELLGYIYTGNVPRVHLMVSDLMAAGDKYNIPPLTSICVRHMMKNLSIDNATNLLVLADRHSVGQLKSLVMEFITRNAINVGQTPDWILLVQTQPRLIADVYMKSLNL